MKINQNNRISTPSKILKEMVSDKEEPKFLVNCFLTRAEYLTKKEQEEVGVKEGIVIVESTLSEKDLQKEFSEILKGLYDDNEDKAFQIYKKFMIDSISHSMDLANKLVEQKIHKISSLNMEDI